MPAPGDLPGDAPGRGGPVVRAPSGREGSGSPGWLAGLGRLLGPVSVRQLGGERAGTGAARLDWIVRFRWAAVAGQLLVLPFALARGWLAPGQLAPYLLTVAALAGLNLLERALARRDPPGSRVLLLHLLADLAALTVLLLLSGGAWNPLAPLVFAHGVLGPLLLGLRAAALLLLGIFTTAVAITVFPVMPPALSERPTSTWVTLASFWLVSGVVWSLTAWLSASLAAQRRLVENLRQEQHRMDRLRAAGALAAGFSHEFATPLNTLRLRLERLRRRGGEADEDLQVAMEAARRCGEVLERMVGQRVDASAIRFETVDLARLVEQVCASWSRPGRRVRLDLPPGPPLVVRLPRVAFAQALLNLLDNAAQAMEPDPATDPRGAALPSAPAVEVRVRREAGAIEVAVLDRGPGWPQVVRRHLGEPFLTTRPEGTGLGLYNVHGLAGALGGRLLLLDRPGGGAVAAIRLPAADPDEGGAR